MRKWIVNQDRDEIFRLDDAEQLHGVVARHNGKLVGFNLMFEDEMLGTFESMNEVVKEINSILNSKEEICAVSGFYAEDSTNIRILTLM